MDFELKIREACKVQIQLKFISIFFWRLKLDEISTIDLLFHLYGSSICEVEFVTLIYEFHSII
jgi:hypothetical protein